MTRTLSLLGLVFALAAANPAAGQPSRKGPPPYASPEVKDGKVTFRLRAAKAEKVGLASSDIPGGGPGSRAMKKGEGDLWELTLDVAPGTYRYRIDVDGVPVVDLSGVSRQAKELMDVMDPQSVPPIIRRLITPDPTLQIGAPQGSPAPSRPVLATIALSGRC